MTHNEISNKIIAVAIKIHRTLGPGLLESVYQRIMAFELLEAGLRVEYEKPIPIEWGKVKFEEGFRADLF